MNRWLSIPAIAAVTMALSACGSSQPGYCGDRESLSDSVDQLSDVDVRANGLAELRDQLQTIKANAQTVVTSARGDFPEETAAIRTSVDRLSTAVEAVSSSPTPAEVASIGTAGASTVQAVKAFVDATSDRC